MENQPKPPKLPFKVEIRLPFPDQREKGRIERVKSRHEAWLVEIKKKARENLELGSEQIRIAWTHRFQRPRYDSFDEYTPEEITLEMWEQWYYEHPESLEIKGIFKKRNSSTGYSYYETGDPLIDSLEQAFGRGETPDLEEVFGHIQGGKDIFRDAVFEHDQSSGVQGFQAGEKVAPRSGYEGVQENEKGEMVAVDGTKVSHDDYSSDEWVASALKEDPILKAFEEKLRGG